MPNELSKNNMFQAKKCWCGGELRDSVHPLYLQCKSCGTLVYNSIIKKEELEKFYTLQNYWHDQQINVSKYPPIEERADSDFNDRIPVWYELLQKHKPNLQYLLEIGCAHGGFLYYCMQRGIPNVVGVEVDKDTCDFAKSKFNLPYILNGLFPDLKLPYNKFDAIVGFDVLEHFLEPVRALKEVAKNLSEDGVCLFQTPCYREEDQSWTQFRPKEHLFLFNQKNIKKLFYKSGLDVIDILPGYFADDMFVIGKKLKYETGFKYEDKKTNGEVINKSGKLKEIVFVRTDSIGDNILASSMLPHIKHKFSDAKLTVICQEHISELYNSSPHVDKIITIDKKKFTEDDEYHNDFLNELKKLHSDLVLNSIYLREEISDEIVKNTHADIKIGFLGNAKNIDKNQDEGNNKLYTNLIPFDDSFSTELEKHKQFLAYLDINVESLSPEMEFTDKEFEETKKLLVENGINSNNYVVLFAGAQYEIRNFPSFGKALTRIAKEKDFNVVALGSQSDFAINQLNLDDIDVPVLNLSGKTTIMQAGTLIKNAVFAIGTETGLAHIACAVKTPNVILLGGGHFGRFMPYSNFTSIVALPLDCYRCNWNCLYEKAYCVKDVDYKVIEEAVRQTINRKSEKARVFIQSNFQPEINKNTPAWYFEDELPGKNNVEIIKVNNSIPLDKIEELIQNKKYDEALQNLYGLLHYNNNDVNVLNNIAVVQILTKQWEDASLTLKNILEIDPANEVASGNIQYLEKQLVYHKAILESEELIKQQNYPDAKKLLNEILKYEPGHTDALNNLAVINIYENDFEEARKKLYRVLEINPEDEIATDNLVYLNDLAKESTVQKNNEDGTLLSIILQGRNDGYMGNFEWRLSTNINKLADNISRLKFQNKVQVILVDWGSDKPLANVLPLSAEAKSILDIIYVEKEIADRYNKDSEYSMVHAINTGIKRASGKYIMFCDGDTYIPLETMRKIIHLTEGVYKTIIQVDKSLFMASRFHIPKSYQQTNPSLQEIDRFINKQTNLDHDKINLDDFLGTATGYLMSRELWFEFTGFDESLIYWGWFDIDLFHRVKSKYKIYDFETLGMPFYHLEHYSNSKNRDMKKENPRKINPAVMPKVIAPNDDNWGLGNENLSKVLISDKDPEEEKFESELNNIIPPEIKNDEFYNEIINLAKSKEISTVLEIGSSAGGGSTEAFVKGLRQNPNQVTMFCMEVSKTRFAELEQRYAQDKFVKCYNVSSVAVNDFPSKEKVKRFYNSTNTTLNHYPVEQVLGWLEQDIEYVKKAGVHDNGIQIIRKDNNIQNFDLVLIDGSEFTGSIELEKVYGAKYILLDDINAFKNYDSYQRLKKDTNYKLIKENWKVRNGYAIFKFDDKELPVHFFTIVLNGEPFIRYHINLLKQLPFRWHWHIIEGVAELTNDTAWSVPLGGRVSDKFHKNGLSKDGTTEYLNKLGREFPDNVTIYRKRNGEFWNGKLEMVNAPLSRIKENALLFEIDSDELWSFDQLLTARKLFKDNPQKTAAYFWCHFYVGENLVTTEKNAYSKTPAYEWIRAWHFKPGDRWISHEPPALCRRNKNGEWTDLTKINPFTHDETEKNKLVYHHYAYVLEEQLKFKEIYYGYKNALQDWKKLQSAETYPLMLKNYFSWVNDSQRVNTLESQGIIPIAKKDNEGKWVFNYLVETESSKLKADSKNQTKITPADETKGKVIIDGVIFQLQKNHPHGIYRVWESLLREFAKTDLADRVLLLDRESSAPDIPNLQKRVIHSYNFAQCDVDSHYVQDICEEENAALFISTYYTFPDRTHNVLLLHDMIPEIMGWDLDSEEWQTKLKALIKANAYFAVSNSTKNDFRKFYPKFKDKNVYVIHNAASKVFGKNTLCEIENFKINYGLKKQYFIISGNRDKYKNAILFFKAFNKLSNKKTFQVLITGGAENIEDELIPYLKDVDYQHVRLSDKELSLAYAGALALVYPSKYEGFGLPVLEAMQCGCPVITCKNSSLTEIAMGAAIFVNENNIKEMKQALINIQKQDVRKELIHKGLLNAKRFSWGKSAAEYRKIIYELLEEFKTKSLNPSTPLIEQNKLYYLIMKDEKLGKAHSRLINLLIDGVKVNPQEFIKIEKVLVEVEKLHLLDLISSLKKRNISDPFYNYVAGLIADKQKDYQTALNFYIEALNAGWTHWRIGYLAALAALGQNNIELAIQLLEMVIKAKPDYKDAQNKLREIKGLTVDNNQGKEIKVSAIVSSFNSEKFIKGCLDDLTNQTLYKKGELEIVVVVSGSEENEEEIVKEYQNKFSNIVLISTENRETVYQAWNRGIKKAKGKYITNANTDDRHKTDALEILANELDKNEDVALVYADSKVTQTENRTFVSTPLTGYLLWPEFDRRHLFEICFVGPQPVWRKSLHKKYGYFDENFKSAGDYEFWLRISASEKFKHVNQILGLYLLSMNSVENSDRKTSLNESEIAREKHWKAKEKRPAPSGAYLVFQKESKLRVPDPQFSVVVHSDDVSTLRNALNSLTQQTNKSFEVVIVSGGNKDLSKILDEYNGKVYIRYLHHVLEKNKAEYFNSAIKTANETHITFLNNAVYYPEHLQLLADEIKNGNEIVYTDCITAVYEGNGGEKKLKYKHAQFSVDYDRNKLLLGIKPSLNNFCISKKAALGAGLFDEKLSGLEDWEFLLRLSGLNEFKHIKTATVESSAECRGDQTIITNDYHYKQMIKNYKNEINKIPDKEKILAEFKASNNINGEKEMGNDNVPGSTKEGDKFLEYFNKAMKNIDSKDYKTAAKNLQAAIEYYGHSNKQKNLIEYESLLNLAGNVALYNKDYELAKQYFEEELKHKDDSSTACAGLAELFFIEENYPSAKMMYEWAVHNDPQNSSALLGLKKVNAILQLSEDDNSLEKTAGSEDLLKAESIISLARKNFDDKNFDEALKFSLQAEDIIEKSSLNGEKQQLAVSLNNFKGFCYVGLNKLDHAKDCFENALRSEPDSSDACAGLGEVFYLAGNDEEAKIMFEWAVKNDNKNIFAVEGLKKVNKNLGFEEFHNSLLVNNE